MKCIAIDDEPLALNVIKEHCSKLDFLQLVGTYTSAIDAVKMLNQQEIDVLFIDIQMPNITGLEFVRMLKKPPMVILTTAYSEYALDGFELNVLDYLLKPIPFDRFFQAVNKAYELFSFRNEKPVVTTQNIIENQKAETPEENPFVLVKVEYSTVKVALADILYIEGIKDYVKIKLKNKSLLTKATMKYLEEKLPQKDFIRVHKSFIISLKSINKIENNRILIDDQRIPIGSSYKYQFNEYIEKYKL